MRNFKYVTRHVPYPCFSRNFHSDVPSELGIDARTLAVISPAKFFQRHTSLLLGLDCIHSTAHFCIVQKLHVPLKN